LLQLREILYCFDSLGRCNDSPVVGLEAGNSCDNIVFAAGPILAWVSRKIDFLEIRELAQTSDTLL